MEAATHADLIFIAVFPEHHSSLLQLKQAMAGKTLVDVSNGLRMNCDGPSNASRLADMFPESSVVKGFNTLSAWTLQMGPRDGSRQVKVDLTLVMMVPDVRITNHLLDLKLIYSSIIS